MNPKLIKKQFEKSFETYNKNATFQKYIAKILISELAKICSNFDTILELGCGTGLLTEQIAKNIKYKKFLANDLVKKSEQYIKNIIPGAVFYCGNAQKIKPINKPDLIISNAMFQWLDNLNKASENFKNLLKSPGILAFTSFTPDNYKEIKNLTGLSLDYKTIEETKNIFIKNFDILYAQEFKQTMKFSNPLELLAHMKNTGVNSLNSKQWTIKDVKNFCDQYKEKYPEITLTYSGMILICKKEN